MGQTAHEEVVVLINRLNWLGFSYWCAPKQLVLPTASLLAAFCVIVEGVKTKKTMALGKRHVLVAASCVIRTAVFLVADLPKFEAPWRKEHGISVWQKLKSANRVVAADHVISSRNSSFFGRATSRLQEVGRTAEEWRR